MNSTLSVETSLDDLSLAFLDVETTGLSPRFGDRICEIAIVHSRLDLIQSTYQTLVNPGRSISPGASAVNHLVDEDVRDAPRFGDMAENILAMLRDVVIVGHNAPFDLGFVGTEMRLAGRAFSAPYVLDTLVLARRCYSFPSNSLSRVARALEIPTPDAHRALGDAMTTRAVYLRFVEDFWKRGVRTLGDLMDLQGTDAAAVQDDIPLPPTIAEALSGGKRLFLKYVDGRGEATERWVTPREVTGSGDTLSLVAFCHLRQERRLFRLDRIVEMQIET